jgi:toxin HigB-1
MRHFTHDGSCFIVLTMRIPNILHKGLKRFVIDDGPTGLPPATVEKLRRMVSFLQDMRSEDELQNVPSWKAHRLSGERKAVWSLYVTRNWRLTFSIDKTEVEIIDLNYEDYH